MTRPFLSYVGPLKGLRVLMAALLVQGAGCAPASGPAPYYAQPGCYWVEESTHVGFCRIYLVRVDDRVVADFHHGEAAQAFIRANALHVCSPGVAQ
jgi:hypothetical protein